jgi:hypothetical protein
MITASSKVNSYDCARRAPSTLTPICLADAESRTVTLLTCVDGLVFDRLVSGGSVSDGEIRGLVGAALR